MRKGNKSKQLKNPQPFRKWIFVFSLIFNYSSLKSSNKWVTWLDLFGSEFGCLSSTIFTIFVLLLHFWEAFTNDTNDHTNPHNNNKQSTTNWPFRNQTFWVTPLAMATFTQSITQINTLTIIHNNTKSTNGSSSRREHNLVIHPLKEILKSHKNGPPIAISITSPDFHNIHENKNPTLFPFAFTTGNKNKQNAKTAS